MAPPADRAATTWSLTVGPASLGAPPEDATRPEPRLEALSPERVSALLAKLGPPAPTEDEARATRPVSSAKPPRPDKTERVIAAPPYDPPAPDAPQGALSIVRAAPSGEVAAARTVSLTFDRAVAPLAAHHDQIEPPAMIEPAVAGDWRWVGTKTALFTPEAGRMPMATTFTIAPRPGLKAQDGTALSNPSPIEFKTPPPRLLSTYPSAHSAAVLMRTPIALRFDQRVDPEAILPFVRAEAGANKIALKVAPIDSIEGAERAALRDLIGEAPPGHLAVFRPESALPYDTPIRLSLATGLPSAEGERVTAKRQDAATFQTLGPLRVEGIRCPARDGDLCSPDAVIEISLTNAVDRSSFTSDMIEIEPPIENAAIEALGSLILISGWKESGRTYTIRVRNELRDEHGQMLTGKANASLSIGPASPMFTLLGHAQFIITDPARPGVLSFAVVNQNRARLRAWRVTPDQWTSYQQDGSGFIDRLGEPAFMKTIDLRGPAHALHHVDFGLRPALDGAHGHLVVTVDEIEPSVRAPRWHRDQIRTAWVNVTEIGLEAIHDDRSVTVRASDLASAEPIEGAVVRFAGRTARTDPDGSATITWPSLADASKARRAGPLTVKRGHDVAMLLSPSLSYTNGELRGAASINDQYVLSAYTDRGVYKPGETVRAKGWIRRRDAAPGMPIGLVDGLSGEPISFELLGPRGDTLAKGSTSPVTELGGFAISAQIPEGANLGHAHIRLDLPRTFAPLHFQIQEFRRPEFELALTPPPPHVLAGSAPTISARASYLSGEPLPGAPISWSVSGSESNYTPPGYDEFEFGDSPPWWARDDSFSFGRGVGGALILGEGQSVGPHTFEAALDGAGAHEISVRLSAPRPAKPLVVTASATVVDLNRQAIGGATSFLVHPASVYVGLRTKSSFLKAGEPIAIEAIVTDIDGNPIAGREVEIRAVPNRWRSEEKTELDEEPLARCTLTSTTQRARCAMTLNEGGSTAFVAVVTDPEGRSTYTRIVRWIVGARQAAVEGAERGELVAIPQRPSYEPGETAKILVRAPFASGHGVWAMTRGAIVERGTFAIRESGAELSLPIRSSYAGGAVLQLAAAGHVPRSGGPLNGQKTQPAYALGQRSIAVSRRERALSIELTPSEKTLAPGASSELKIAVTGPDGEPARAELGVVLIDEAILSLTGHTFADPLEVFFSEHPPFGATHSTRSAIALLRGDRASAGYLKTINPAAKGFGARGGERFMAAAPMMASSMEMAEAPGAGGAGQGASIELRSDFDPLALFLPVAKTDADGRAMIPFELPDTATRYRVMVAAVSGPDRFGKAESSVTARLPLTVRPSLPRFLHRGDRAELPLVVQNGTDRPMRVELAARTSAALALEGSGGFAFEVPALDRVEVRLPTRAERAGTARLEAAALSGIHADAARAEIPVWIPATPASFATYESLDGDKTIALGVRPPPGALPDYGALSVTTSATALTTLTDAYLYLRDYPYECSEQIGSRLLAVAELGTIARALDAASAPSEAEQREAMEGWAKQLGARQLDHGGFGFWNRTGRANPFADIHIARALVAAKRAGAAVDVALFERALERTTSLSASVSGQAPPEAKRYMRAYAHRVLRDAGRANPAGARALYDEFNADSSGGAPPSAALAWLLPTLQDAKDRAATEIVRSIENRASETASAATIGQGDWDKGAWVMRSTFRGDAAVLRALIDVSPGSDLIEKLVRGLNEKRSLGRWPNTQDNSFVLSAMRRYFDVFEKEEPNFRLEAWLGDRGIAKVRMSERGAPSAIATTPMAAIQATESGAPLVVQKRGPGRAYLRIGMEYARPIEQVGAIDHGFVVERSYEPVDDAADLTIDQDGSLRVRAGARVRVRLRMVAPARRAYVALEDHLPAGFEPVNAALANAELLPEDESMDGADRSWWWSWTWYDHSQMRDERVEAFATWLPAGVHDYSYIARATTPGTFVAPAARAFEMYAPETFGRSAPRTITIAAPRPK